MKILVAASYCYDPNRKDNLLTGAGTFIYSIVSEQRKKEEVDTFWFAYCIPKRKIEIARVLFKNIWGILPFAIRNVRWMKEIYGNKESILNLVALSLFAKKLKEQKPEVVHFHGYPPLQIVCSKYCDFVGIPNLTTIHLYLEEQFAQKDATFMPGQKKWFSVVSSGMKARIMKEYPHIPEERIRVVLNGTDFEAQIPSEEIRKTYGISDERKVLLCIGSICERKNQIQILRVMEQMPPEQRNRMVVFFCGTDMTEGWFEGEIESRGLKDCCIYAGALTQEKLHDYYNAADGLISTSKKEGFPMVFLEALVYGLPVLIPAGLDSNEDFCHPDAVCIAKDTSDKAVLDMIETWYDRKWDADVIRAYAKQFRIAEVAKNYTAVYQDMLNA